MATCIFANCGAELPPDTTFTLCERCRIIDNRNSMALVADPHSPLPTAFRGYVQRTVTQMTGEEMVAYVERIEQVYLEFCKLRKLYAPEGKKRVKLSLVEEVETLRDEETKKPKEEKLRKELKKKDKKKESVLERQQRLLGCDEATAKRIFNDDFGDI